MIGRCGAASMSLSAQSLGRSVIGELTTFALALLLVLAPHSLGRAEPRSPADDPNVEARNAAPGIKSASASADDICRVLVQAALDNELPIEFFTRLIWQE